jgi:hypothetical protein
MKNLLFDMFEKKNANFTTKTPPSIVVAKLEDIAQLDGRFKVIKKNEFLLDWRKLRQG